MRKAAFRIVEGESQAEVTVIDLPASGGSQVTDVAANMARWAGQVGLTELGAEGLQKLIEPVTVDGARELCRTGESRDGRAAACDAGGDGGS